jgi:hypothetical protein
LGVLDDRGCPGWLTWRSCFGAGEKFGAGCAQERAIHL